MWGVDWNCEKRNWGREIKVPLWQIVVHYIQFSRFFCVLWSSGSLSRHHSSSHSEGRCPWHWEEHCGCGAELQQLQVCLFFSSLLLKIPFIMFCSALISMCFVGAVWLLMHFENMASVTVCIFSHTVSICMYTLSMWWWAGCLLSFRVIDLGVMVPCDKILREAMTHKAGVIEWRQSVRTFKKQQTTSRRYFLREKYQLSIL